MWIVYTTMAIVVILISYFWASGIDYMHKNYPDYKGNGTGLNFDDDIDWDVTSLDGLHDEDEYMNEPIYKFNNGNGAMLCNKCRTIISTGPKTDVLYCEKCENELIYKHNPSELETMTLINEYRASIGLVTLKINNYISHKSEEHNTYMINNKMASHNGFTSRSEDLISTLGAKKVGENVGYNYSTPQAVVKAWLNSPKHKENLDGDYTHFGISIKQNPEGKNYYTNIFAKLNIK